jgi:hypothetical protein
MCNPKTENPDIAWRGDVYKIWVKPAHLRCYPILIAAKKRVAGQLVVQGKCRRTSFDFHRGERWLMSDLCARSTPHAQEGKLPATSKGGELFTERR